jgi:hypothetical protein
MSELQRALELFGFLQLDDINGDSLKKAFKNNILKIHPDRGGDAEMFDDMLHSYVYLSETIQRIHGGRATLQNIISPDDLKNGRADQIINRIFDEFDHEKFNAKFETKHKQTGGGVLHGYADWLKSHETDSNSVIDGKYGNATQPPPEFEEKDLNTKFEDRAKKGKLEPTSIILHPEAMAYVSGSIMGTDIIQANTGSYTSEMYHNPEYTDVYAAFTTENTICDKVTSFSCKDDQGGIDKELERIIAERNSEIKPLSDNELKEIQEFERRKLEQNNAHLSKIKEYFGAEGFNSQSNITETGDSSNFIHIF